MVLRLTRRRLLAGSAVAAGGGLVLLLAADGDDDRRLGEPGDLEPDAYLQVRPDGAIILQVDKLEMGQGVMTGFVTLLAEELAVRPEQIAARHAPVHARFQTPSQLTAASNSMRTRFDTIRQTGAAAREMLRLAAARRWQVGVDQVVVNGDATLTHRLSGLRATYGELAAAAADLPVPARPPLTAPADFRWIGRTVQRPDAPDKVTGRAVFGSDVRLDGMLTAVVVRPPRAGDRLVSFAAEDARAMRGVREVLQIGAGIAVVAQDHWHARRAAGAVRAEWQDGPAAGFDAAAFRAEQRALLSAGGGKRARDDGSVDRVFAAATRVIAADYATPFLAHLTMETMNATVRLGAQDCELWVPGQAPDLARQVVCDATGLQRGQVTVHTTFAGGGFGRRAMMDFVAEAIEVALQLERDTPVQLIWSREDDLRHDYYRCATAHRIRGAIDANGNIAAWDHALVAPDHSPQIFPLGVATLAPEWLSRRLTEGIARGVGPLQLRLLGPFQARDGSTTVRYASPNLRVSLHVLNPALPVGIWRSVGYSYNVFVAESFIDELAHFAGEDPAVYRRRHLAGEPRHVAVLDRLLSESGWGRPPPGRFHGMALHDCFGTVVGQVAEVSVSGDRIQVHRVTCVVDCGTAVNPDVVRAQLEGGILFGLNAALLESLEVRDGRVQQGNFDAYPMLRLADAPAIETHIMASTERPGGIGEAGTPGIAPAVANAVFAATGRRLRQLPLRLDRDRADG